MFPDIGTPIRQATNDLVDYLVIEHGDFFEAISNGLLQVLVASEQLLRAAPPWLILVIIAALAYAASRRLWLAGSMAVAMWLIGALGLWDQAMQTIAIMVVSVGISTAIGVPLGILAARSGGFRRVLQPLLDVMQTIPSLVYLIPAAMLFGLGKVPAILATVILATVIHATPPLIRLTDLGIRLVDNDVVEASRAFGASRWQILKDVQIPLALPSIMQGINQV